MCEAKVLRALILNIVDSKVGAALIAGKWEEAGCCRPPCIAQAVRLILGVAAVAETEERPTKIPRRDEPGEQPESKGRSKGKQQLVPDSAPINPNGV